MVKIFPTASRIIDRICSSMYDAEHKLNKFSQVIVR